MYILVDFDGVLADTESAVQKVLGMPHTSNKEFWKAIYQLPSGFASLDMLPDAQELLDHLELYPWVSGCTATGNDFVTHGRQKLEWAAKNQIVLDKIYLVRKGVDKAVYATPQTILIDDTPKVIEVWVAAGGIGILHTSAKTTIAELEKLWETHYGLQNFASVSPAVGERF